MANVDPIIAIIVAVAENGVIGREGDMPWRLPSDLKFFRRTTMGKPLIMGRKTFVSLGRPLDGRDMIVLTRDKAFSAPGVLVAHDLDEALRMARECARARGADEIMVIGGAELYRQALPLAARIYLTRVHVRVDGDVSFPEADFSDWQERSREPQQKLPKDDYGVTFITLDRVVPATATR